jgi:hypothetical protein
VTFSAPSLFPSFSTLLHDYVVRCNDAPVTVDGHATGGWQAAIGGGSFGSGDFSELVPLRAGQAFVITVRESAHPGQLYRYYVRCLPANFLGWDFARYGPVWPRYISVDTTHDLGRRDERYAIIFNNHGVPIWWYHTPAGRTRVLPDGKVLWFDRSPTPHRWEVHRLDGSLVRTLEPVGPPADDHDLQFMENGDYLLGAYVKQDHVDTSAYGGSSDATVVNAELQQVSPEGQLVWDWRSQDHIGLAETERHWPWAVNNGYDIVHWNSIEESGSDSVIASFRHLDGVYKIRRSTGAIVWKLGGTETPRSLTVKRDRFGRTFGAQHDARVLSDGTVTVFDNRTGLRKKKPRAVRFRIDPAARTATLLQSITDPAVIASYCCGSVRVLDNGDWLIAWGKTGPVGGYDPEGRRTFILRYHSEFFSTRAEPVPAGAVSAQEMRAGMDAMYGVP